MKNETVIYRLEEQRLPLPQKFSSLSIISIKRFVAIVSLLAIACATLMVSAASAQTDTDQRSKIETLEKNWVAALKQVDTDSSGIARLYAVDAVVIPPNGMRIEGDGIIGYWKNFAGKELHDFNVSDRKVEIDSRLAYITGRFHLKLKDDFPVEGFLLTIFCKRGDEWKICAQTWSVAP